MTRDTGGGRRRSRRGSPLVVSGDVDLRPGVPRHRRVRPAGHVQLIYRNMLIGGEPGGGKSSLLNVIVAHAALASDCRLCLFDGKQVELGQWGRARTCSSAPTSPGDRDGEAAADR